MVCVGTSCCSDWPSQPLPNKETRDKHKKVCTLLQTTACVYIFFFILLCLYRSHFESVLRRQHARGTNIFAAAQLNVYRRINILAVCGWKEKAGALEESRFRVNVSQAGWEGVCCSICFWHMQNWLAAAQTSHCLQLDRQSSAASTHCSLSQDKQSYSICMRKTHLRIFFRNSYELPVCIIPVRSTNRLQTSKYHLWHNACSQVYESTARREKYNSSASKCLSHISNLY